MSASLRLRPQRRNPAHCNLLKTVSARVDHLARAFKSLGGQGVIIAHFFTRKVRGKTHLFVETTSSNGLEQPEPAAIDLMTVDESVRRQEWVRQAYYEFEKKHPNLVLFDTMDNFVRLESSRPSFDLVFKPKELVTDDDAKKLAKKKNSYKIDARI